MKIAPPSLHSLYSSPAARIFPVFHFALEHFSKGVILMCRASFANSSCPVQLSPTSESHGSSLCMLWYRWLFCHSLLAGIWCFFIFIYSLHVSSLCRVSVKTRERLKMRLKKHWEAYETMVLHHGRWQKLLVKESVHLDHTLRGVLICEMEEWKFLAPGLLWT